MACLLDLTVLIVAKESYSRDLENLESTEIMTASLLGSLRALLWMMLSSG